MTIAETLARARRLRLMAFDVDGVLTDGSLYLSDSGEELKAFNTLDGHGLKMLQEAGVELAIITGRSSRVVARRAENLGIRRVHQGVERKLEAFEALRNELGVALDECGYMGDDLPDLPVLMRCGFAVTVPAAPEAIRTRVHYVATADGGRGAVREVCELILRAQGKLESAIAQYLR